MPGPEDSFGITHESDTVIAHHTPMNVDADDDLYEAEKIVDTMIEEDGTKVYRIRWAGCSEDQDTWEPIENLPEDLLRLHNEAPVDATEALQDVPAGSVRAPDTVTDDVSVVSSVNETSPISTAANEGVPLAPVKTVVDELVQQPVVKTTSTQHKHMDPVPAVSDFVAAAENTAEVDEISSDGLSLVNFAPMAAEFTVQGMSGADNAGTASDGSRRRGNDLASAFGASNDKHSVVSLDSAAKDARVNHASKATVDAVSAETMTNKVGVHRTNIETAEMPSLDNQVDNRLTRGTVPQTQQFVLDRASGSYTPASHIASMPSDVAEIDKTSTAVVEDPQMVVDVNVNAHTPGKHQRPKGRAPADTTKAGVSATWDSNRGVWVMSDGSTKERGPSKALSKVSIGTPKSIRKRFAITDTDTITDADAIADTDAVTSAIAADVSTKQSPILPIEVRPFSEPDVGNETVQTMTTFTDDSVGTSGPSRMLPELDSNSVVKKCDYCDKLCKGPTGLKLHKCTKKNTADNSKISENVSTATKESSADPTEARLSFEGTLDPSVEAPEPTEDEADAIASATRQLPVRIAPEVTQRLISDDLSLESHRHETQPVNDAELVVSHSKPKGKAPSGALCWNPAIGNWDMKDGSVYVKGSSKKLKTKIVTKDAVKAAETTGTNAAENATAEDTRSSKSGEMLADVASDLSSLPRAEEVLGVPEALEEPVQGISELRTDENKSGEKDRAVLAPIEGSPKPSGATGVLCLICNKRMKNGAGLTLHLRRNKKCAQELKRRDSTPPVGWPTTQDPGASEMNTSATVTTTDVGGPAVLTTPQSASPVLVATPGFVRTTPVLVKTSTQREIDRGSPGQQEWVARDDWGTCNGAVDDPTIAFKGRRVRGTTTHLDASTGLNSARVMMGARKPVPKQKPEVTIESVTLHSDVDNGLSREAAGSKKATLNKGKSLKRKKVQPPKGASSWDSNAGKWIMQDSSEFVQSGSRHVKEGSGSDESSKTTTTTGKATSVSWDTKAQSRKRTRGGSQKPVGSAKGWVTVSSEDADKLAIFSPPLTVLEPGSKRQRKAPEVFSATHDCTGCTKSFANESAWKRHRLDSPACFKEVAYTRKASMATPPSPVSEETRENRVVSKKGRITPDIYELRRTQSNTTSQGSAVVSSEPLKRKRTGLPDSASLSAESPRGQRGSPVGTDVSIGRSDGAALSAEEPHHAEKLKTAVSTASSKKLQCTVCKRTDFKVQNGLTMHQRACEKRRFLEKDRAVTASKLLDANRVVDKRAQQGSSTSSNKITVPLVTAEAVNLAASALTAVRSPKSTSVRGAPPIARSAQICHNCNIDVATVQCMTCVSINGSHSVMLCDECNYHQHFRTSTPHKRRFIATPPAETFTPSGRKMPPSSLGGVATTASAGPGTSGRFTTSQPELERSNRHEGPVSNGSASAAN